MDDPRDEFAGPEQVHRTSDVPKTALASAGCFDTEILSIVNEAEFKKQLSDLTPQQLCELLARMNRSANDNTQP
jgi:hypothetical protein